MLKTLLLKVLKHIRVLSSRRLMIILSILTKNIDK